MKRLGSSQQFTRLYRRAAAVLHCGYRDVIESRQVRGCKSGLIASRGKKYIIIIIIITITVIMNCEGPGVVPVH